MYGHDEANGVDAVRSGGDQDVAHTLELKTYQTLHPSWMYRTLHPYWMMEQGLQWLSRNVPYGFYLNPPAAAGTGHVAGTVRRGEVLSFGARFPTSQHAATRATCRAKLANSSPS
jgi:hypothetical protein